MEVSINGSRVTVRRAAGERRVRTESDFWFRLREEMRRRESNRWKKIRNPGALTSMPFALREGPHRKVNRMILDPDYAIRCPAQQFNTESEVMLALWAVDSL